MPQPVIQNALQLRHFADHVSSLRGKRLNVCAEEVDETRPFFSIKPLEGHSGPGPVIMELDTVLQNPDRKTPEVSIRPKGAPEEDAKLLNKYDAVFWSEAAVEKFVFPYYASKMLWMASHYLTLLSKYWYGFVPGVDEMPERHAVFVEDEEMVPCAVAHLPTSDYILLGDSGQELHILFRRKRDGAIVPKSLADLARLERERGQNG